MNQQKSLLNPYATPYIPVLKRFSGVGILEEESKASKSSGSGKNEQIIGTAGFQLSDTTIECNNPSPKDLYVSDASSSKMACQAGGMFQEESTCNEKQILMEDHEMKLDSLGFMYPMLSRESLAEVLDENLGDLDCTVNMLDQQEF